MHQRLYEITKLKEQFQDLLKDCGLLEANDMEEEEEEVKEEEVKDKKRELR